MATYPHPSSVESASGPGGSPDDRSKAPDTVSRRDALFAAGMAVMVGLVTGDAWRDIFRLGLEREELSYVLLAPVVITWLFWSRRHQLARCRVRGEWAGMAILLGGYGIYWYGFLADPVLWRAGAVVAVVGGVLSILGSEVLMASLPAFVAAVFLIPVSPNGRYRLAEPLQNATAAATQTVCDLLGIYVERTGNLLTINGVEVSVAEACNGMRMILTLFLVCYLVAFTSPLRPYLRVALLAASPVIAIVTNVARLVPTVWLFGHSELETAERFHSLSGWGMTVVAFVLLMGGCAALQSILDKAAKTSPAAS
jgi:exosortase